MVLADEVGEQLHTAYDFRLSQPSVIVVLIQGYDTLIVGIIKSQIAPAGERLLLLFLVSYRISFT